MKKSTTLFACGALAFTCAMTPIKAAGDINTNEQKILDYITSGFVLDGEHHDYKEYSSTIYNDVKSILSAEGVDLSSTDVDTVVKSAKDTLAYMEKNKDATLTAEIATELVKKMSPAAEVVDIKISYDVTKEQIVIKDKAGNVIDSIDFELGKKPTPTPTPTPTPGNKDNVLENTGENFTSTYIIIGGLFVVVLGAGLIANRKKGEI